MAMHKTAALIALPLLTACATTQEVAEPVVEDREVGQSGTCDARSIQAFVGDTATQDVGAHLLKESGARVLQWIPPDSAVTMDYRRDRLRVGYDYEMTIDRIVCQ